MFYFGGCEEGVSNNYGRKVKIVLDKLGYGFILFLRYGEVLFYGLVGVDVGICFIRVF